MIKEPLVKIWVYNDKIEIPMLFSQIPIVGKIANMVRVNYRHGSALQSGQNCALPAVAPE